MASTIIGALSVEITADTKGLKAGLKGANNALGLASKKLRKGVNEWGKWASAATIAAAGVAAALVKTNLSNIRELKNTAQAANTTVAAFERGAFAAEQFGISQEKYGDILKDTNDRVGDFLISGAGPMADFFETIAPKVGITADAFKGLSGEQSLGLYIKSLQDAGVSQQEMTFFMEALASDSTRLTPLFQDNAKVFNELTKEAKDLGIGLSEIDVTKAEMASSAMAKASGVIDSMTKQLAVELAPILTLATDKFVDMAKESGGASSFIQDGISKVTSVVGVFADGLRGIEVIFKILEVGAVGFSALVANIFAGVAHVITGFIDTISFGINKIISYSNDLLGSDFGLIPSLQSSDFVKSVKEVADNIIGLVSDTNAELAELVAQPLPSDEIKAFVDEGVAEYQRLAEAKTLALSNDKTPEGEGAGTKKTSEIELFQAETVGLLEALGLRFQSQEEITLAHLQREREMIDAALANGEIAQAEHSEKMADIKQAEVDIKREMTLRDVQQGFQILASGSKKIQKAMEIAAVAQAVIKGKQAAVDAWQAGMSVGGPYAPLVAAAYTAASLANTASMIKSIKSGGGGGGKPSASIPSGGSSGGGQVSQGGGQQQAPQQGRTIDINFSGQGSISSEMMRDQILPALNEALGDGAELNINGG